MNTDVGMSVVNMKFIDIPIDEWLSDPNNLYVSKDMTKMHPGLTLSKWSNPFCINKCGWEGRLQRYEMHIIENKELRESLKELEGKTLGCFCRPAKCHGDVLIKLYKRLVLKLNV